MSTLILLTDGSACPKTKIGYGAYLLLTQKSDRADNSQVRLKRFEMTSSTKLELETLLWALNEVTVDDSDIQIYTDSQNIINLPSRKEKLRKNNYLTKNGKYLKNHELYKKFFAVTDNLNYKLIQVRGHMASQEKSRIDQLFTIVDRASRNALRKELENAQ